MPQDMVTKRSLIAVSGALAQSARRGGLTWFFLQFVLGLNRLGWDVVFLDHLKPSMCGHETADTTEVADSGNVRYFLRVMQEFGLEETFSLDCNHGEMVIGLSREEVLRRASEASVLLNVMGYLDDE